MFVRFHKDWFRDDVIIRSFMIFEKGQITVAKGNDNQ